LWPVEEYLTENYRQLHPADIAVIEHHSAFYRRLAPDSVRLSLEFGAGPNLYPLMLAASASRCIHAVERSAANIAYLTQQLRNGPDPSWEAFYAECRRCLPTLPSSLTEALSRVRITHDSVQNITPDRYDLASMNFVAESVTEDLDEFNALCALFVQSVRPGGLLVAAFMENMGRYCLGDGSRWPGYPVETESVWEVFRPRTRELRVTRIDADATLPDYGYTGMVLMTARRAAARR